MADSTTKQAIQLFRTELERERKRAAELEARAINASEQKVLDQTRINIGELANALAAHGVNDA